jgi:hypothetical protein
VGSDDAGRARVEDQSDLSRCLRGDQAVIVITNDLIAVLPNDYHPRPATELADATRETIVLALSSTTAPQTTHKMGDANGYRCALGVVLEALGFQLQIVSKVVAMDCDGFTAIEWQCQMRSEDVPEIHALIPSSLMTFLVDCNDKELLSFDDIAKRVKDWTPEQTWEQRPGVTFDNVVYKGGLLV